MREEKFLEIIENIKYGNLQGIKEIYDVYIKLIYHVIYNIVQKKEDAEDITSDFFVKLIKNAPKYQSDNHKAWLVTVAKNMAYDYMRKNKKEVLVDEVPESNVVDTGIEINITNRVYLEDLIKILKPKEKEIIDLKILGGFTFKEISKILKLPMGTVTWDYNSGLKKLRRAIANE